MRGQRACNALTNSPSLLPPAIRESVYVVISVSFGPSPLSAHAAWMAVPAVSVVPALGLVKVTPALAKGTMATRAARGSIDRAMAECGEADNERLFTRGFDGRSGAREGAIGRLIRENMRSSCSRGVALYCAGWMDRGAAVKGWLCVER
jgi:hypothetical protein